MLPGPQFPRFRSFAPLALFGTLILALMWVSPGRAVDGRDFAGFFNYTGGSSTGDPVLVTFSMRVNNHSNVDVSSATVTVRDGMNRETVYATFNSVSIAQGDGVKLSADISVSRAEYDRWENGNMPTVEIEYLDSSRDTRVQRVQLARMPAGVE